MTTESIAKAGKAKTREERGLRLYREMGEEIEHAKGNVWLVPSCSVGDYFYAVDLSTEECECPDRVPKGEVCKHTHAARIANDKSAMCDGCYRRFPRRELTQLDEENHDGLTHFDGDLICEQCRIKTGVL